MLEKFNPLPIDDLKNPIEKNIINSEDQVVIEWPFINYDMKLCTDKDWNLSKNYVENTYYEINGIKVSEAEFALYKASWNDLSVLYKYRKEKMASNEQRDIDNCIPDIDVQLNEEM